ncbi:tRNA (adenosine(37)-N6)-threonylcarbamoyltransferase complex dimerization subunit type 1 TsaB [Marilutibacter alkalisoli]|uniref:tRNA threonylcarbamoyladenosine biosynthesis protein TsaB n=1 Tax=Marilutibacter alkalisoli TaxID=2591633 RepID=A0A514BTU3_9GAMM|nr:tRNA (adenosine(37)-N6)-threonylcarbamoyltransferase complex dimerization subunit type 1 TsaB [Lysobacter alkalisoli]QDH70813.1 tRNA (adenosine(37)-N6)-threonylcarbamoyltransferase complex dimerization subunit type 1 TsaB [Lysobacter alkalisoli]
MKILALETATEACSVALWLDGEVVERFQIAPRRHAELALPWAGELLAEAGIARSQLDAIAVGRGPGAFTGVRLAIALAQGMALALDRPLLPVSTLAALSMRACAPCPPLPLAGEGRGEGRHDGQRILAAIDARMGEIYVAAFERRDGEPVLLDGERVLPPADVVLPGGEGWHGVGTGFDALDGALQRHLGGRLASVAAQELPHAADVARLGAAAFARGEAVAPEQAEPAYLRNNVALTIAEQQALRQSRS